MTRGDYAKHLMLIGDITREAYFRDKALLHDGHLTELHCHDLTAAELKAELQERHLKVSGTKTVLRDRLVRAVTGTSVPADLARTRSSTGAGSFAAINSFNVAKYDCRFMKFAAVLHAPSVYTALDDLIHRLQASFKANAGADGWSQQAEIAGSFTSRLHESGQALLTVLLHQGIMHAETVEAAYDLLRALHDSLLKLTAVLDCTSVGYGVFNASEGAFVTEAGEASTQMYRGVKLLHACAELPWSLLAMRGAASRVESGFSHVVKQVLKDATVRSINLEAWLQRDGDGGFPAYITRRTQTHAAEQVWASALRSALHEPASKQDWGNVWVKAPRTSTAKRGKQAGVDSRFEGPKHKRTRSYWYEDVMSELDPERDEDFIEDVIRGECMHILQAKGFERFVEEVGESCGISPSEAGANGGNLQGANGSGESCSDDGDDSESCSEGSCSEESW